jgi:hypothetical protein
MDTRNLFYSVWSGGIGALFLAATVFGYSPFADGGRSAARAGIYGPTHK